MIKITTVMTVKYLQHRLPSLSRYGVTVAVITCKPETFETRLKSRHEIMQVF